MTCCLPLSEEDRIDKSLSVLSFTDPSAVAAWLLIVIINHFSNKSTHIYRAESI